jgi:hypothetical protein
VPLGAWIALAVILEVLLVILPPGLSILDARLFYTRADATAYLAALGPKGRHGYFLHEVVDLGFIATYTTLLRRLAVRWKLPRALRWLAFAPGAADLVETGGILAVLAVPAAAPLVAVLGATTAVKWAAAALVVSGFGGALAVRRRR